MNNQVVWAFIKSVALRFLKGGVAGALAAIAMVTLQAPTTWAELSTALVALTWAATLGFFTGGFLAIEKAYNWTVIPPKP